MCLFILSIFNSPSMYCFSCKLSEKLQVSPSDGFIVVVILSTIQQLPSLSSFLYFSENSDSLFCNAIIEETSNKLSVERGMRRKAKDRSRERISVLLQLSSPLTGYWFRHFVGALSLSRLPLSFAAHEVGAQHWYMLNILACSKHLIHKTQCSLTPQIAFCFTENVWFVAVQICTLVHKSISLEIKPLCLWVCFLIV